MKWVFIGEADYASSAYLYGEALKTLGHEVQGWVAKLSPFKYPHTFPATGNWSRVESEIAKADAVWIIQSDLPRCWGGRYPPRGDNHRQLDRLNGKFVVIQHGGSYYRKHRRAMADIYRDHVDVSICHEADLMGGFPREHVVIPPAPDVPDYPYPETRTIGHFPSRAKDKGSEIIRNIPGITYEERILPWPKHIERMGGCDAIIDQMKPTLDGGTFGEWCSNATEAAALGRIVLTNSLNVQPYIDTYGEPPGIVITNTEDEMRAAVEQIQEETTEALRERQRETLEWVRRCHSIKATGRLLKELLGV